ncbi:MAG: SPFH domain-containing protein [Chloroflexota bacterium]|nr:SPFH domain-containing protein [Chloroflexota bacterium]MDE2841430.1 SPFH domain-containing protein [Chloroflexota bacterium]MDE2932150.1 SPFH domain-containing protein [Chloroflexota bacterium]
MQEYRRDGFPGVGLLVLWIFLLLVNILIFIVLIAVVPWLIFLPIIIFVALMVGVFGFFKVAPNEGKVLQLFGAYRGTARQPGLRYTNPFYSKARISLRVRNFETGRVKVNDQRGNPIEIAAVVVWQVVDTAEATFQVDDYENYVHVQSEAAVRNLATGYAYDAHGEDEISLTTHTAEVSEQLKSEIQERLAQAGVDVREARVSHLAYAPEIAAAMLRRQQADAVIAARQKIVEGAVGMVENALGMLAEREVIEFDAENRAALVSNLLVVLTSENAIQPVVNTSASNQ